DHRRTTSTGAAGPASRLRGERVRPTTRRLSISTMVGPRISRRAALLAALVVVVVAAAVLLAIRPWESAPNRTFTAVGTIDLIGSPDDSDAHPVIAITDDNSCYGALSFGDLDWSAPVTVLDGSGGSAKLAGGSLSEGRLIDGGCEFT